MPPMSAAPQPPPSGDTTSPGATAQRALDALRRSAARARRVAAQTGTRLVVVRDGKLVIEPVEMEPIGASEGEVTPTPDHTTDP